MKIDKPQKVAIAKIVMVACMVLVMLSVWTIDVATSSMLTAENVNAYLESAGSTVRFDSYLINGFGVFSSMQMYHVSLWLLMMSATVLVMMGIYLVYVVKEE